MGLIVVGSRIWRKLLFAWAAVGRRDKGREQFRTIAKVACACTGFALS